MKEIFQQSEQTPFNDLSQLIEQSKKIVIVQANSVMTMLLWNVGKRINEDILQNKRADYGKRIVSPLARQLSWSHFRELIPIKDEKHNYFTPMKWQKDTGENANFSNQSNVKNLSTH